MLIVLGVLAIAALGGIIYVFISEKSSKMQKYTALGALALSGLAILICAMILIFGSGQPNDPYAFPLAAETVQPEPNTRTAEAIIFLVVLLLIFGLIIYFGIRDHKKKAVNKPEIGGLSSFRNTLKKTVPDKAEEKADDLDLSFDDDFDL